MPNTDKKTATRKDNNVTRRMLVEDISAEEGFSAEHTEKIILSFLGKIKTYVNNGKAIELRSFGRFSLTINERNGFYPLEEKTNAKRRQIKPKFKPSKYFILKANAYNEKNK